MLSILAQNFVSKTGFEIDGKCMQIEFQAWTFGHKKFTFVLNQWSRLFDSPVLSLCADDGMRRDERKSDCGRKQGLPSFDSLEVNSRKLVFSFESEKSG